ncbi:hypothetical protein [Nereida sp. MMG025]|uniref:hypothetical protein n=1 Tax=Nereida sp. MMG025 TaxID=2909981 RepID=UPI001F36EE86|nr:hypothetical protein [Nereida sp. MMG025]MCF6443157.1 hypothetical protein [Nereida sp. MMG025]
MRISWSKHHVSSDPAQPSRYLLAEYVPRWINGRKVIEQRRPTPELLLGDPFVIQSYLAVQRTQRRYRSLVLSFHEDDIDVAAFNSGSPKERGQGSAALSFTLETAFPGIPPANRPPILASTHTHLGRLEINIVSPRFAHRDVGAIRSYNPNPPKSSAGRIWCTTQDLLNEEFGWYDPNSSKHPAPVGPDWLERKHRSAMRSGVTEFLEDPQVFILDQVKGLANRLETKSVLNFALDLASCLMDVGYRLGPLRDGRLTVKAKVGSGATVFKGGVLGGRASATQADEDELSRLTYDRLWRRMAVMNARQYRVNWAGHDAPKIGGRPHDHPYDLPLHHPNCQPLERTGLPRAVSVAARLTTVISKVARRLQHLRTAVLAAASFTSS